MMLSLPTESDNVMQCSDPGDAEGLLLSAFELAWV